MVRVLLVTKRYASHQAHHTPTSGIVSFNLADVGEGIAECEILKWYIIFLSIKLYYMNVK